jgi:hypothetical protein
VDRAPLVILEGVDGTSYTLSSSAGSGAIFLQQGAKGLDMLPWDVQVDEYPALDGEFPRAVRGQAREIFLPLVVYGATRPEMIASKRALLRALNPSRFKTSMARLVVAEARSTGAYEDSREIEVYYSGGLEGDEGSDNGMVWGKFGLILRSTDPFFKDTADTVHLFETSGESSDFFPPAGEPFLSVDGLTGGFVISDPPVSTSTITVNNRGDVAVYPTWSIVGPVVGDFNLVRQATSFSPAAGLVISDFNLAAGQQATIDTSPGSRFVTGSAGAGISWSNLGANPQFWTLDPGDNTVSVTELPVGVSPSQFTMSFRPKYLGM